MDPLGSPEARQAFHEHQDCLMQVWKHEQKLKYAYTFLAVCVLSIVVYIAGPAQWHWIFGRAALAIVLFALTIYVFSLRSRLQDARVAKKIAWTKYQNASEKAPLA